MKQLVAVVDRRTTMLCLRAAGQVKPVDQPFDTLGGSYDNPPFHDHCRSISVPWMPGFTSDIRVQANAEIRNRPLSQRKFGPEGYQGWVPRAPQATPEVQASMPVDVAKTIHNRYQTSAVFKDEAAKAREALAKEGTLEARYAELVSRWTGPNSDIWTMREEIARGEWDDVLAVFKEAPSSHPTLYRTFCPWDVDSFEAVMGAREGSTLDLGGLSSFTERDSWARTFTNMSETQIMLIAERGPALPVAGISNTPGEAEWLATGKFRVTEVVYREVIPDPYNPKNREMMNIVLTVRGVIEP